MGSNQIYFDVAKKKGEIGEKVVRDYLESKGWIVYFPFTKDKPHYFDMLATKDKEKVIAIDVKTKARLNNWVAQGIDIRHYNQYLAFVNKNKVPFYLIFVDDKTGDVHCADIRKLKNGFNPGSNKAIIAWKLDDMQFLFKINANLIKQLSSFDQRNYDFNPTTK